MKSSEIPFESPAPLPSSPRAIAIAAHFGVLRQLVPAARARRLTPHVDRQALAATREGAARRRPNCPIAAPSSGEILLLGGASGSGKSSLLRAMRHAIGEQGDRPRVIDLRRIPLPDRPIVDLFDEDDGVGDAIDPASRSLPFAPILRRLSRVGLAEVWSWLRPPSQLSEGQRWRLRLALAMHAIERDARRLPTLIVCDEFAALLDRITASVIAGVLRRFVDRRADHVAAVVATSHDDLQRALEPDLLATCDFGVVSLRRLKRRTKPQANADHRG